MEENEGDGGNNGTGEGRTIRSVAFAPTPPHVRNILAAASFDGSISIWEDFGDTAAASAADNMADASSGSTAATTADATADATTTSRGWECTALLEGHDSEVKDVAWNSTGTLLASCGRDKSVWIWECFLAGTIGSDGTGGVGATHGTSGGGGEGDFECVAVLSQHSGDVKSVVFAPSHAIWGDGDDVLLSASYDDTIKVWAEDAGDWYCAVTLQGVHTSTIWSLGLYPGGVRMVSASADCSLAIWRCYTAMEKRDLLLLQQQQEQEQEATSDMKKDEKKLKLEFAGQGQDGMWKCVGTLPKAHENVIYSVDCAPARAGHGRIASAGADNAIHIYREVNENGIGTAAAAATTTTRTSSSSEAPVFCLDASKEMAHDGDVNCIQWHPYNGAILASAGDDGVIKIWNYSI